MYPVKVPHGVAMVFWAAPFLVGAVLLVVALGLAALPHRRPAGRTLAGASDPAV